MWKQAFICLTAGKITRIINKKKRILEEFSGDVSFWLIFWIPEAP